MKILPSVCKSTFSFPLFAPLLSFILVASALMSSSLYAQNVLALENVSRYKRIVYVPGDMIRFQLEDSKTAFSGRIESVNDSQVVILKSLMVENEGDASNRVFREYVSIDKIRFVYKRPSGSYGEFFYGMMSGGLVSGGLMYVILLPIDAFFGQSRLSPTNMAIGAGMLATGGLLALLRKKKQRVGDKWVLKSMVPITPEYPSTKE